MIRGERTTVDVDLGDLGKVTATGKVWHSEPRVAGRPEDSDPGESSVELESVVDEDGDDLLAGDVLSGCEIDTIEEALVAAAVDQDDDGMEDPEDGPPDPRDEDDD